MRLLVAAVVVCVLSGAAALFAGPGTAANGDDLVARGRYLVGPAGQCADCHGANLHGQPLGFMKPGMPVSYYSAYIAGLKQFPTTAAAVKFFETGRLPNGKQAAPPMPQYRFNHSDAEAITAYLKTLK